MSATPAHRQDRANSHSSHSSGSSSNNNPSSPSQSHIDSACPDIEASVKSAQIAGLYERAVQPALLGWVFGLLPLIALWPHLPHGLLLGWFAARSLVSGLRCADAWQFRQFLTKAPTAAATAPWLHRFMALLALDAMLWGSMGLLFHAPSSAELDGLLLAAMVGVTAVGLLTLGARFQAGLLFSSLTVLPLVGYYLSLGSQVAAWTSLGLMLFLAMALAESRRLAKRTSALLSKHFADDWLSQQRQQALQSAEQSNTSKSRFVAVMSHEIRTPLNGILGMTQLLERSELNGQQREQIDIVRRSGRHLLALVNDILDLARIESGKLSVDAGPVNVRETLDDVCGLLGLSAREKGLGFTLSLNPALPHWVLGDSSRIKQVLHNLIGNAIKFTERGQVAIDVSPLLDMRAGNLLRFAVRDTGEGIAADQLERVFAPFEQAAHAPSAHGGTAPHRHDGTGLGLTISRELARAMGGELRCSSVPGQGSLFEFTLPLRACAPSQTSVRARGASPAPRLSGRVLLVDDSMVNVLVAASMLERCGLQVDKAEDGLEALERLESLAYDLVLMDCQMPRMDGFEATRRWRVRERLQAAGHLPIVALTASAVNGDRERCLQAGMDDYLVKPFEMDDLVAVVQRHLQVAAAV